MAYRDVVLADSPVLYWRLGESVGTTANDETANNLDGTYANTPTLGVAGALVGDADTAVTFTAASSEQVSVADPGAGSVLDVGDTFTLEAWVKRASTGTSHYIMSKGTSDGHFGLRINGADSKVVLRRLGIADIVSSTTTITADGNWHHVVCTKSGATVKLYIDGSDVTGTVTNSTMANNNSAFNVSGTGGGFYFDGSIDEAALYATALSAARVTAHYEAGLGPTEHERAAALAATAAIASAGGFWSVFERSVILTATGTVASTGQRDLLRAVAFAASAALASDGHGELSRSASLSATGEISSVGQRDLLRAAALLVQSAIIAAGEVEGAAAEHERAVALAAASVIASVGQRDLLRATSFAATAAISAVPAGAEWTYGPYPGWLYAGGATATYEGGAAHSYGAGTASTYNGEPDWTYSEA